MATLGDFTLYHRAVRDVRGEVLLSLNALRVTYPDVYARAVQKYTGREALLTEPVLPLDGLWTDVLFFSPVHPKGLLDAVRASGREIPPVRFWAVNAALLEPGRACVHFVKPWKNGIYAPPQPEDYAPFNAEILEQVSVPSPETLGRLSMLPLHAPLILWSDVPHVLYRGQIPLTDLQEFMA